MPGYWNDDQGGGQAPPSYPVSQPSGGHPGGWVSEPPKTFSTPPQPDPVVDGRSAALQTAADESANKYLTGIAEMATDEHGRTRNIYDLETNEPLLTFDDGKVVRTSDRGGGLGVVGDKGQLLSDLERMQLAALKMGHKTSLGDPVHGGSQFESGLGSLITLDSEGNPMYTDEGELMYTGLGGAVSDNWNQFVTGYDDPSGYGQGDMLQDIIDDYYASHPSNYDSGGQQFFDPGYYDPRQETLDKLRFLQAGLPQKRMEQQGFFNELEEAYQPGMDEALDEGIFSGAIGQGVMDPKGLKRLISSYGSGVAQPRYTNVARGGIIGLLGV